jgi:acyl carrier protein
MDDAEVFGLIRGAIIWAKSDVAELAPGQVTMASSLAEPPICLDSLEFVAMVTHLEEKLGLIAEDEHFFSASARTVADVVEAAKSWIAEAEPIRP